MNIKAVTFVFLAYGAIGCSFKPADKNDTEEANESKTTVESKAILTESGVLMPDDKSKAITLDPAAIQLASDTAIKLEGSRAPYDSFHTDIAPLLPTKASASFNLSPVPQCELADTDGNTSNDCKEVTEEVKDVDDPKTGQECPKVCATACASATATAAAAAFAHASVQACAFAEAWACVYSNVPPFGQVCSWAKGEACASAFATAFGFGYATSTDQECKTVCSDGTTTVTKGPTPVEAVPAAQ
jgi:hypothetical protein